jgi:serine/threonine protein kinase
VESNRPGPQAPTGWNPDSLGGTQLGSCWLEDPLSISSMGAVFLARQERPHRYVAVKVIHRQLAADPAAWALFLARFQREADATAALDHANIVPIYEFGETGDLAYLVMPYLPDGSLATRLEQHGPLPLPTTLLAVEQVAAALDYAHARGIVHRDVKPSNMLLHPDGRVLLADFGIARPLHLPVSEAESSSGSGGSGGLDAAASASDGTLTQAGSAMGTPEFMAPEQVRGGSITPATDTYALGIATYELLGGQTPFAGANVPTILLRQVTAPPPPLQSLRSDLPARVEEVVFWALAKDPADRPASPGAFARALRAAVETSSSSPGTGGWPAQLAAASVTGQNWREEARYSSGRHPASPDHTVDMPPGAMPPVVKPEFAVDEDPAGDTTLGRPDLPIAYGGAWPEVARYGSGGAGGGRAGSRRAPLWPTPRPPDASKLNTGQAAVVGLAISCVALVILSALLITSIHSALGSAPGGAPATATSFSAPPGQSTVTPAPTSTQLPPTATITPSPVPTTDTTPISGDSSLSVSPTQVTFGCPSPQSQTVQLSNTGPSEVLWTARTSVGQPGTAISISPASGSLPAGRSQSVTLTESSASPNSTSQGTILFVVDTGQATGNPAQVTYTISACNGAG